MTSDALHLVRLKLRMRGLIELARARRLPWQEVDDGYLVHSALGEIFRDLAPKPFAVTRRSAASSTGSSESVSSEALEVHAYSRHDAQVLKSHADAFGSVPLHDGGIDWSELRSKPLPSSLPPRVGFRVRLCPVVRLTADVDISVRHPETDEEIRIQRHKRDNGRGPEVDAFEAACIRGHLRGEGWLPASERARVYLEWCDALLGRVPDLRVVGRRIEGQQWTRLVRREHRNGRRSHTLKRPDVTLSGVLEAQDPTKIRQLLAQGIGRHRAFGFGMLLLLPPGEVGIC